MLQIEECMSVDDFWSAEERGDIEACAPSDWNGATSQDMCGQLIDDLGSGYAGLIHQTPLLTAQQEVQLGLAVQAGGADAQAARTRFVEANQLLVISVARKYRYRGLPFLDLIQEGNVGLLRAIAKYDPQRGNRFSTHAIWWIRQSIIRALEDMSREIRLPTYIYVQLMRMKREEARLHGLLERLPTDDELAPAVRVSVEQISLLRQLPECVSLSTAVKSEHDDDDLRLEDTLASTTELDEEALVPVVSENLWAILRARLSTRELTVITLRFGLCGEEHKLETVGSLLGITRERVRQIEHKALLKLRKVPQMAALCGRGE